MSEKPTWSGLFGSAPDFPDPPVEIGEGDRVLIRGLDGSEVVVVVDRARRTKTGYVLDISSDNDESPRSQPEG